MNVARCTATPANRRECGGVLRSWVDRLGVTHFDCERCARRKAGICADCPRPIVGRVGVSSRCAEHQRVAQREANRRYQWRQLEARRLPAALVAEIRQRTRPGAPPLTSREAARFAGLSRSARQSPRKLRQIARLGGQAAQRNRQARRAAA